MLVKGPPVAQASTRTAVQALTARLAHVPRVTGVVNTYTSPDPQLRSHDGRASLIRKNGLVAQGCRDDGPDHGHRRDAGRRSGGARLTPVGTVGACPWIPVRSQARASIRLPPADRLTRRPGGSPPRTGGWHRVPPCGPGLEAVVSFTGHAVFAVAPDIPDHRLAELGVDGFGGAHDPRLIAALTGPGGWIDCLDMLMAGPGTGSAGAPPPLIDRPDLAAHRRVRFAARIRSDPRVLGYPDPGRSAIAIISRGHRGPYRTEL